ncbi:uncharacterized protein LACBIDRAFT_306619 [Laccaria bicolor S238N-H82]|uniref:Predicted protein n=1 Tax=Laccaria bicolor (strain S238N-H82 / ATCC MYA-4686) TaxID=486041 RepID=B0DNF8_LACBS|nr:uncharacterized protein LACBIDRAFT_306619 [Laccaria bicolor S238N-H82]EDR03931.1 predicted protein [Laccaria bicolor S238N-H82]|eukprot:XP_001885499.1 predicted protein [Laccaria bicolor S238N-H82]
MLCAFIEYFIRNFGCFHCFFHNQSCVISINISLTMLGVFIASFIINAVHFH